MSTKIEQVEPQFAQKLVSPLKQALHELRYFVPDHYQLRVSLLDANGRKKRSNASAENWSPESGRIEIRFEPAPPARQTEATSGASHRIGDVPAASGKPTKFSENLSGQRVYAHPAETDLLKILANGLDRAESKPGWNFVPLRKFRDEILPHDPIASKLTDVDWREVLRSAISKRLVLVGRVPNPKAPEFPVTTIRLNRLMPEVQAILGPGDSEDMDFHPVEIRGEPLSTTILRERR
jgi:hypothetical protein